MRPDVEQRLRELIRRFYDRQAGSFGTTRAKPWPGWARVVDRVPPGGDPLRVLDAGCGNGRFGVFCAGRQGRPLAYVGTDQSRGLLDQARDALGALPSEQIHSLDWQIDDLAADPPELPDGRFDLVVCFGVLHHLPRHTTRRRLLHALASRVTEGGRLAVSWWRLDRLDHFAKKRRPWSTIGLTDADVEAGDALLAWQGDELALRYLHFPTDDELASLDQVGSLDTVDRFESDGRSGRENLFVVYG